MKTSVTSNFRPLLRGFYAFFIAIAVVWAVPRNAHAGRLYVVNVPHATITVGVVSEYDTTSGLVIKDKFITGLRNPRALALSDNALYNALFVANRTDAGSFVGKYDATTGAAINASLITLNGPLGLVVSDKDNVLFVGDKPGRRVGTYNATTGAVINADFITGLEHPSGLALSGNTLFVTDVAFAMIEAGTVGKYDATTGVAINGRFIKGLTKPFGLAVESAK